MEGWLYKQGQKVKSWKNRWHVLSGDRLQYYKKRQDHECEKAAGGIHIRATTSICCDAIILEKYKREHCAEIRSDDRTLVVSAMNANELQTWVAALRAAVASSTSNASNSTSSMGSSGYDSPSLGGGYDSSGFFQMSADDQPLAVNAPPPPPPGVNAPPPQPPPRVISPGGNAVNAPPPRPSFTVSRSPSLVNHPPPVPRRPSHTPSVPPSRPPRHPDKEHTTEPPSKPLRGGSLSGEAPPPVPPKPKQNASPSVPPPNAPSTLAPAKIKPLPAPPLDRVPVDTPSAAPAVPPKTTPQPASPRFSELSDEDKQAKKERMAKRMAPLSAAFQKVKAEKEKAKEAEMVKEEDEEEEDEEEEVILVDDVVLAGGDWVRYVDVGYNRHYFYNVATEVTVWATEDSDEEDDDEFEVDDSEEEAVMVVGNDEGQMQPSRGRRATGAGEMGTLEARLRNFYETYAPEDLSRVDIVDIAKRYGGKEEFLVRQLGIKYGVANALGGTSLGLDDEGDLELTSESDTSSVLSLSDVSDEDVDVGDMVEIVGKASHLDGEQGKVVEPLDEHGTVVVELSVEGHQTRKRLKPENLKFIRFDFQVGDSVEIIGKASYLDGQRGKVIEPFDTRHGTVMVELQGEAKKRLKPKSLMIVKQ